MWGAHVVLLGTEIMKISVGDDGGERNVVKATSLAVSLSEAFILILMDLDQPVPP